MKGFASWMAIALVASVAINARADSSVVAAAAQDAPKDKPAPKPEPKPDPKPEPKTDPKPADPKKAVEAVWGENYDKALAEAKKSKRVVMADFTGSDWCVWCQKLKAEVFDTPEFKTWAVKNVVLLEVDFPHEKKQSDELKKQNEKLLAANKKDVEGYPTILFFNAKGEVVGKTGYVKGGPEKWIAEADKILSKAKR